MTLRGRIVKAHIRHIRAIMLGVCMICLVEGGCSEFVNTPFVGLVDTSSRTYSWRYDTLGVFPSYAFDLQAFASNQSLLIAQIHEMVQSQDSEYNAARWDGQKWRPVNITYLYGGSLLTPRFARLNGSSLDDYWANSIHFVAGQAFPLNINGINRLGSMMDVCVVRPKEVYFTGTNGSILFYDGNVVRQIGPDSDGSNIEMACCRDTMYVAAQASVNVGNHPSCVIKVHNGCVVGEEASEYGPIESIWSDGESVYVGSQSRLYKRSDGNWKRVLSAPTRIRKIAGTGPNNVFVILVDGSIVHYNGENYRELIGMMKDSPSVVAASAISGEIQVAFNYKGRVIVLTGTLK